MWNRSLRPVRRCLLVPGVLGALMLMSAAPAAGEDKPLVLAPIVVTAEKREENVQDIPASVSVLPAEEIEDSGLNDIGGIAARVPNMRIVNWGMRGNSYVFVRGIGAVSNDPAVGFYVDDVNYGDSRVFDSNLFDIERIEVLRGPQGTLYGRNSLGGVINIVTKKPDNEFHAFAEQTFGDYETVASTLALRAPLVKDKLFFGVSGMWEQRDGYTRNDFDGDRVDSRNDVNGRAQLRWLPTENLDITASVDAENDDDGAVPVGLYKNVQRKPHHVDFDADGKYLRDSVGTSLRVAWDTPQVKVTSISAFRTYRDKAVSDQDFTPLSVADSSEKLRNRQFTQELRLASPDESRGPLKWLGGVYYYDGRKEQDLDMNVYPFAMTSREDSTIDQNGVAVFGQATYTLFERLDITAGLRYDYSESSLDYNYGAAFGGVPNPLMDRAVDSSQHSGELLPKFQIAYRWTPEFMTYAGISKGYRSGGFNSNFQRNEDASFDPEYSWTYELGLKSTWFDNRMTFNAALFYIDLEDQQVVQLQPGGANMMTKNAGRSRSMGVEAELTALLAEGLTFEGAAGWNKAEYREYSDSVLGADYKGNSTPLAPEYTYSLALQYRVPLAENIDLFGRKGSLGLFTRAEVLGMGPSYWDDANTIKEDAYELVNIRAGLETGDMDLVFWVNNLFDTDYNAVVFTFPGYPTYAQSGDPRTFGATFRVRF